MFDANMTRRAALAAFAAASILLPRGALARRVIPAGGIRVDVDARCGKTPAIRPPPGSSVNSLRRSRSRWRGTFRAAASSCGSTL